MTHLTTFQQLALAFPETNEQPHFEKPSFRVKGKIFATIDLKKDQACVKLSPADQDAFSLFDQNIIFPVPNKWGQQGWTFVNLSEVSLEILAEILTTAYCEVAPVKLAQTVRPKTI